MSSQVPTPGVYRITQGENKDRAIFIPFIEEFKGSDFWSFDIFLPEKFMLVDKFIDEDWLEIVERDAPVFESEMPRELLEQARFMRDHVHSLTYSGFMPNSNLDTIQDSPPRLGIYRIHEEFADDKNLYIFKTLPFEEDEDGIIIDFDVAIFAPENSGLYVIPGSMFTVISDFFELKFIRELSESDLGDVADATDKDMASSQTNIIN
ncbi:hypothetical protein [Thiomicrorhabdus arctica]|uniref:hypothetical protein n=1 Tax=Thiomicrorhabdus arctica TaxID=131540 RepID=UPI00037EBB9D|nr:hypothetical protein [Thiomicrorhabdus arctica]